MGEFSFPVPLSIFCVDSFGICSTPVLLQWHVKGLGHSAESVGGSLHKVPRVLTGAYKYLQIELAK